MLYEVITMSIAFNAGYMIDIVGAIDEEDVEIHLREGNSSSMILGKGSAFNRYIIRNNFV